MHIFAIVLTHSALCAFQNFIPGCSPFSKVRCICICTKCAVVFCAYHLCTTFFCCAFVLCSIFLLCICAVQHFSAVQNFSAVHLCCAAFFCCAKIFCCAAFFCCAFVRCNILRAGSAVQHLCKPEIAGNLGGRRKTENSNKPNFKRQI